jgi:hypothetical protein
MTGKLVGAVVAVIGAIFFVAGATTWFMVQDQLTAENIVVADDANWLAGDEVNGPFSAYAEADIINHHALEATGDKTYAELDREDPLRATAMNASFLRASLFTSVVAFGVAAFAMVIGLVLIGLGLVVRKIPTA